MLGHHQAAARFAAAPAPVSSVSSPPSRYQSVAVQPVPPSLSHNMVQQHSAPPPTGLPNSTTAIVSQATSVDSANNNHHHNHNSHLNLKSQVITPASVTANAAPTSPVVYGELIILGYVLTLQKTNLLTRF